MAQLLISAAGAAIGFAIGGPAGASIGWGIGGLVGSGMGPGVDGPRLSDTKVQISSYGASIPRTWGGVRVAGNVIWSTRLIEDASSAGGKGGPSVTTYSYSVSCAVAVAEGVVPGVRRIWADAKLVYDVTDPEDGEAQAMSVAFADFFTWYTGAEDQLPDPTIEAVEGAGNVPAYRGTAYIVFTALPLGDYGNRIPNFSFELAAEPADTVAEDIQPLQIGPWAIDVNGRPVHSLGRTQYRYGATVTESWDEAYAAMLADNPSASVYQGYWHSLDGRLSVFGVQTSINAGLGARLAYVSYNTVAPGEVRYLGLDPETYYFCGVVSDRDVVTSASNTVDLLDPEAQASGHWGLTVVSCTGGFPGSTLRNYCGTFGPCLDGGPPGAYAREHTHIEIERLPSAPTQRCEVGDPCMLGLAQMPGTPTVCISCDGTVSPNVQYVLEEDGDFLYLQPVQPDGATYAGWGLGPVLRDGDPRNTQAFWDAAAAAAGISGTYGVDYPVVMSEAAAGPLESIEADELNALLSDIVTDICVACGLTAEQIDVSALTDIVPGYVQARQMSGRQALEPLRQAFWFDAVESGAAIRFVPRGGAPVATITLADMGAAEGDEATDPMQHERAQETELPAVVAVAYASRLADYQTGTQRSTRTTTGSQQAVAVELPIVLTDLRAAQVADVLMYDAWISRMRRTVPTVRKWAHIEPTDPLLLDDGERVYRVRCVDKTESGPVVTLVCVDEDVAAYSPAPTPIETPTGPGGGTGAGFAGPTRVELMDIPIVADTDNQPGYYVAGAGYTAGWPGGRLFRSTDAGASYAAVADITVAATIGFGATALPAWTSGNMVDERNTVTVRMHSGELASITRDQLLDGGNLALLGDEVLQFQRATLVSAGVYTLSGLLRGRRGTEHLTGAHEVDERFVLLTPALIQHVTHPVTQIGVDAVFRAVSLGQPLAASTPQNFTDTGASLRPFSPVHVSCAPRAAGGYTARWTRRTRLAAPWAPLVDVPLGEAVEQYRLRVLDGTTVVLEQTVAGATTADLGSSGDDYGGMTLEVCQVSESYGPGVPGIATIP